MRRVLLAAASLVLVAACAGSSSDGDDALAPVAEGTNDITASSKLAGDYADGKGHFASLSLARKIVSGKTQNAFAAKVIVQCVRAPCPAIDMKGRWFAHGTTLTLYPENESAVSYTAKLDGTTLTLSDSHHTALAELTKQAAIPKSVTDALAKYGATKMKTTIAQADIDAQSSPASKVSFASAVDTAVKMFLTDEAALPGYIPDMDADEIAQLGCKSATKADMPKCIANAAGASIRLMAKDESPPEDGDVAKDWVFELSDGMSDYGYYAVIPRDGAGEPQIYSFN